MNDTTIEPTGYFDWLTTSGDQGEFDDRPSLDVYAKISKAMFLYGFPLLMVIGLVGNVTSFLLMTLPRDMSKRSISVYLSALAVGDTMVIINMLVRNWLSEVISRNWIYMHRDIYCKGELIFRRFAFVFSGWTVVCVSAERLMVTAAPLQATSNLHRRARKVVLVLVLLVVAYSFAEVLPFGITIGACDMSEFWAYIGHQNGRYVLSSLYAYIPTVLILTFNIVTAVLLMIRATESQSATGNVVTSSVRATRIVLAVSVSYLCLTIPANLFLPYFRQMRVSGKGMGALAVVDQVCFLCFVLNHSVNFFLYVAFSSKFRRQCKDILSKMRYQESVQ